MNYNEEALKMHLELKGKLSIESKVKVDSKTALSLAYTPGVAEPCRKINKNEDLVYSYTMKGNTVAVVTDGTAVLGLGDIGAKASIPVMEGKAVLFKEFAGINAFPICLETKDVDEIVNIVKALEPVFGGINLEDIAAPRCFEIERRLKEEMDIPVFHDDQHGTAIIVGAALINGFKVRGTKLTDARIVINGAGSAGTAIAKLLLNLGVDDIVMCDIDGALDENSDDINEAKKALALITNKHKERGSLKEVIKNKDVFIGVSAPNVVTKEMIMSMNERPLVFAMANPNPEISPDEAKKGGAFIVGTGRSDYPNQINNVLAFPGIFRGALDVYAKEITEGMKMAAARAIADVLDEEELSVDKILPLPFDKRIVPKVSMAVKKKAIEENVVKKLSL
ncbi:NAD(P)-dependent malic enzyme [Helicovermis profundi]|uniref:NADP-dependent malic enzyme n=1 Tax=Helicovermis profundi TaxID=3065157 RepID=A0AAU9E640_9FIRM|nr:NADP-dependent malic enzyme [Clostridia bacterium S502]